MSTPDPVISVAESERDVAADLLRIHRSNCPAAWTEPPGDCPDCRSLAGHVDRTARQVALLAAPGETEELF